MFSIEANPLFGVPCSVLCRVNCCCWANCDLCKLTTTAEFVLFVAHTKKKSINFYSGCFERMYANLKLIFNSLQFSLKPTWWINSWSSIPHWFHTVRRQFLTNIVYRAINCMSSISIAARRSTETNLNSIESFLIDCIALDIIINNANKVEMEKRQQKKIYTEQRLNVFFPTFQITIIH